MDDDAGRSIELIVTGLEQGPMARWRGDTELSPLPWLAGYRAHDLHPGGRLVSLECEDRATYGHLLIADITTGRVQRLLDARLAFFASGVFSPAGDELAAFGSFPGEDDEETCAIWIVDLATGTPRRVWGAPGGGRTVMSTAWSPDSRQLAVTWALDIDPFGDGDSDDYDVTAVIDLATKTEVVRGIGYALSPRGSTAWDATGVLHVEDVINWNPTTQREERDPDRPIGEPAVVDSTPYPDTVRRCIGRSDTGELIVENNDGNRNSGPTRLRYLHRDGALGACLADLSTIGHGEVRVVPDICPIAEPDGT